MECRYVDIIENYQLHKKEFGFTPLKSCNNEAGNVREFCLNLISKSVCALNWNVLSTQTFEQKNLSNEEVKIICTVLKSTANSVCLYPIKEGEEPMYHNCVSLCSLCQWKEGTKAIHVTCFHELQELTPTCC